ncbi:MAG: NAD-binding protein [Sulfurimonas sp.]
MKSITAFIFGFNNYSTEIVDNIIHEYENVHIYSLDKQDQDNEKYEINIFDLSDEWNDIDDLIELSNSIAFCILEDDAQNVFLTISLRARFENLVIVSLAKNKESSNKLEMAGANKVIPVVQNTADIISSMLLKPIATKVLHSILYEEGKLEIAQISVENADAFDSQFPADIDWSRYKGVVVLSVMHENMVREFIYSSQTKHRPLKNGDILVVAGYEEDIKEFEKLIGRRKYVNWSNWSR